MSNCQYMSIIIFADKSVISIDDKYLIYFLNVQKLQLLTDSIIFYPNVFSMSESLSEVCTK